MKTGFKNPIEGKEGKSVKNPWSFDQTKYDERSSCFINAGTHQGVGKKQPVGTVTSSNDYAIPTGRVDTLKTYDVPYERLEIK